MILKGKAQGGARKLAVHLCRTDQNERVRLLTVGGLNATTISEALRELDDLGAAADTKRSLYHGIIAPRANEPLTPADRREAVSRMAKELGLESQAFIVVGHLKKGETVEHYHVVWSRIDQRRQAGISDSHNYRKHEKLARELEQDFGLAPTKGVHLRDKGLQARPERTPDHWEMQQQQRTGLAVDEVRQAVTETWRTTRTGRAFAEALSQSGFIVARGDRRDFVLVDAAGGVHSLARRIEGAKAKDVRTRMADVAVDELETVAQARRRQRVLQEAVAAEQDNGRIGLSAAARLRLDELEAERKAGATRPTLHHTDREAEAAVRALERLGTRTHVVGQPVALRSAESVQKPLPGVTRVAGASPEATQRASTEVESRTPVPKPAQEQQSDRSVGFLERLEAQQRAKGQTLADLLPKPQRQKERRHGLDLEI